MESPGAFSPTPMKGVPPESGLEEELPLAPADPIAELDPPGPPIAEAPKPPDVSVAPVDPVAPEAPDAPDAPDAPAAPVIPLAAPKPMPGESIPWTDPRPVVGSPASGSPKNPLTVVLLAPTAMVCQSSLPVMGSG